MFNEYRELIEWERHLLSKYKVCNKCKRYICKEENKNLMASFTVSGVCKVCYSLYFTLRVFNKKSNWLNLENYYPLEYKQLYFKKNKIYFNGKGIFYVCDITDIQCIVYYGRIEVEEFTLDGKLWYNYVFVKKYQDLLYRK